MGWPVYSLQGKQFKVPWPGCESLTHGHGQCAQDLFALCALQGKTGGTYLDMGCWEPAEINNTYLLETAYGWTGMGFDLDAAAVHRHPAMRKNPATVQDCTQLDWDHITNTLGHTIDYLSLDLEPAAVTWQALQNIPWDRVNFHVITFEHDEYRFGTDIRDQSRLLLQQQGYDRLVSSIGAPAINPYEDWYVRGVDLTRLECIRASNTDSSCLFR